MKIFFLCKMEETMLWAGDKKALHVIVDGLKKLGHEGILSNNVEETLDADFVFLANVCIDLNPFYQFFHMSKRPYGLIPFHEDFFLYSTTSGGFFCFVKKALRCKDDSCIEELYDVPEMVRYFPIAARHHALENFEVIKNAKFCIANSNEEAQTIKRDCPLAVPKVIHWTSGQFDQKEYPYNDAFIRQFGLEKKGYILQIGRLELRKNQLATILATRQLDIPLVLICTTMREFYEPYIKACFDTIKRWRRKAPTYILSNDVEDKDDGLLKIRKIPGGLSQDMLLSAYQNAGLYLHPAFYETPGYTYLEAAKLGTPCIASHWSTIKNYFVDPLTGQYTLDDRIVYCLPHRINEIEKLVLTHFGREYAPSSHPIFDRTSSDVARELIDCIDYKFASKSA